MKKIAVVLSGCGNKDGAEITEAVSLILCLSQSQVEMEFFAPDKEFTAVDFLTGKNLEKRNVLHEAARITRSKISDIKNLNPAKFDGLAFPGGYGAALHLCDWASKGSKSSVDQNVETAIVQFHQQNKPIAAICIAPALIARVLGQHGVTVTIGDDKETAQEIEKTGAVHEVCPVTDYVSDRNHKVLSTPAYMYGEAKPADVFLGISKLVKEFVEMA
jgi:enhancing lycopene biosynthesis protein 2